MSWWNELVPAEVSLSPGDKCSASHICGDTINLRERSNDTPTKLSLKGVSGQSNVLGTVTAVCIQFSEMNNPQPSPKVFRLRVQFRDYMVVGSADSKV